MNVRTRSFSRRMLPPAPFFEAIFQLIAGIASLISSNLIVEPFGTKRLALPGKQVPPNS